MSRITKSEFMRLMGRDGYMASELEYLFYALCKTTPQVRRWVIDWLLGKGFPEDTVEQVTVRDLVDKGGLKPLTAFLAMDWLLTDPAQAKYGLTHLRPIEELSEEAANEILRARANRIKEAAGEDIECPEILEG